MTNALSSITNTQLEESSQAWLQETLPVRLGGLEIRRATDLAPSAYLASIHASSDLVQAIHPPLGAVHFPPWMVLSIRAWSAGHDFLPPVESTHRQKIWDHPRVMTVSN